MAAQLGYKPAETVRKTAVENTRLMMETLLGMDAASKQAQERKK